jgi:hypothetical protein
MVSVSPGKMRCLLSEHISNAQLESGQNVAAVQFAVYADFSIGLAGRMDFYLFEFGPKNPYDCTGGEIITDFDAQFFL